MSKVYEYKRGNDTYSIERDDTNDERRPELMGWTLYKNGVQVSIHDTKREAVAAIDESVSDFSSPEREAEWMRLIAEANNN